LGGLAFVGCHDPSGDQAAKVRDLHVVRHKLEQIANAFEMFN